MPSRTCQLPIRIELRGSPGADRLGELSDALARTLVRRLADAATVISARDGWDGYRQVFASPAIRFSGAPLDTGLQRLIAVAIETGVARAVSGAPTSTTGPPLPAPASPTPPPAPPPPPPPPVQTLPQRPAAVPPPLAAEQTPTGWRLNGVLVFEIDAPPLPDGKPAPVFIEPKMTTRDDGQTRLEITVRRDPEVALTLAPGALHAIAYLAGEIALRDSVIERPVDPARHVLNASELQHQIALERDAQSQAPTEVVGPVDRLRFGPPVRPKLPDLPDATPHAKRPAGTENNAPAVRTTPPGDQNASETVIARGDTVERRTRRTIRAGTVLSKADFEEGRRRALAGDGLILPLRLRSPILAELALIHAGCLPDGRIRVRLRRDILSTSYAADGDLRIPSGIGEGVVVGETEVVGVKFFDEGEVVAFFPAMLLPHLGDDATRSALVRMALVEQLATAVQLAEAHIREHLAQIVAAWPDEGPILAGAIEALADRLRDDDSVVDDLAERRRALAAQFERWRETAGAAEPDRETRVLADLISREVETILAAVEALPGEDPDEGSKTGRE